MWSSQVSASPSECPFVCLRAVLGHRTRKSPAGNEKSQPGECMRTAKAVNEFLWTRRQICYNLGIYGGLYLSSLPTIEFFFFFFFLKIEKLFARREK